MQLPRLAQCVLNSSSGRILKERKNLLVPQIALSSICGQKSKSTRSRKSLAAFQLRRGALLGCAVTLRGAALYSFLDQYVTLVSSLQVANKEFRVKKVVDAGRKKGRDFAFGGDNFTMFPSLEVHWVVFAATGGFNCTFCVSSLGRRELTSFLTALQLPVLGG